MTEGIKEEIYKCSKCGLCNSVCPIFLATKNEMFSPRGRYIVLNNYLNNGVKPSKSFFNNLDICLNCNLCKKFCPSDIDYNQIALSFKNFSLLHFLKIQFYFYSKKIFNLNKRNPKKNISAKKVVYFEGCYNNYIDASDRNATIYILEYFGYEVSRVISNCCGYKYLSTGAKNLFIKNQEKILKQIDFDCEYIICSCDTCYENLQKFSDESFKAKLIRLDEFLKIINVDFTQKEEICYFKPLIRKNEFSYIEKFNTCFDKKTCSLMENFFVLKYPKLASKIINNVANKLDKKFFTTCNITKLGFRKNFNKIVLSLSEFLYEHFSK